MIHRIFCSTAILALTLVAAPGLAKDAPPPQPSVAPDWSQVRSDVETAVRQRLVDPDSARIEWPYGFKWGGYKPMLRKRIHGWATCVMVNGRNRMGGYTGNKPAVIVYLNGVQYMEFLDDQFGIDSENCAKAGFPAPPTALVASAAAPAPAVSVADEIAKLAELRDRGIITPEEFDAQKAKLLGTK